MAIILELFITHWCDRNFWKWRTRNLDHLDAFRTTVFTTWKPVWGDLVGWQLPPNQKTNQDFEYLSKLKVCFIGESITTVWPLFQYQVMLSLQFDHPLLGFGGVLKVLQLKMSSRTCLCNVYTLQTTPSVGANDFLGLKYRQPISIALSVVCLDIALAG